MSTANGAPNGSSSTSFLSPEDAMKTLESYSRGDGLALAELMDSRQHGGLTYNDFLILPGHISFPASVVSLQTK
jgi:IMP dehydrogenase